MLFVGTALLIAAGLALMVSSGAGALIGLTEAQTGQLLPFVIILIIIAGGLFGRRHRLGEILGGMALWAGLFAVVIAGYSMRHDILSIAGRVVGELAPGVAVVDSEKGTATFRRGLGGHFEVRASINGAEIPLIFDTGASAVVLTAKDAEKAGFDPQTLRYLVPVSTANGTGMAAGVVIERIDVGGIVRTRVQAFVAEDGALETSLLGMTFLETLHRYAVSKDALELAD